MRPWLLGAALALAAMAGCIAADEGAEPVEAANATPNETAAELTGYQPAIDLRERVQESVEAGETVELEARAVRATTTQHGDAAPRSETPFEVELEPGTLVTNETWAEVEDERTPLPDMDTYEGHVAENPDWPVRLTLTDDWARGYILANDFSVDGNADEPVSYQIRLGLDGNVPPTVDDRADGRTAQASADATSDQPPTRFDPADWPGQDCLELVPPFATPVTERPAEHDELRTRIVLDGDARFKELAGDHAFPLMVAMMQETDAIYQVEHGIRYHIEGLHLHEQDDFPQPSDETPLGALSEYWNDNRSDVERDVVHLFTGHASGFAQANCIGGAGIPDLAYTFTPFGWAINYTAFHTTALAHELGHIFSAHHHYGNHAESGGNMGTLMIQGYTPGIRPAFSSLSDASIRGWADQHLGDGAEVNTRPGLVVQGASG